MANKAQSIEFLLSQVRASGVALAGGEVEFFVAGTSTRKTVWLDRDKVTPAANPYTLDANGTALLYGDGIYRIVIRNSAGEEKYDRDYISIKDASNNVYDVADYASLAAAVASIGSTSATLQLASDVTVSANLVIPSNIELMPLNGAKVNHTTYTISYAGSTSRWPLVQIFNGTGAVTGLTEAYAEWFGADTADSDNSAAFTKALAAVGAGGTLRVSPGMWNITSTIIGSAANQTIEGAGWGTIINQTEVTSGKGGISTEFDGLTVRNIQIASPTQIGNENAAIVAAKGDASAISDITVEHCYLNKFSYGVSITNATRPHVEKNLFYSTGDDSADQGGAIQISQMVDGLVSNNVIDGDPANRFQHGMYIASDVTNSKIIGNVIKNGFYSYGIHVYGTTFVNGRNELLIEGNIIKDVPNGILVSRSTAGTGPTRNVTISHNMVNVPSRTILIAGQVLQKVLVENNQLLSTSASTSSSIEIVQGAAESLDDVSISNNAIAGWGSGKAAVEINGVIDMDYLRICDNAFRTVSGGGTVAILTDDPATAGYGVVRVTGNSGDAVLSGTYQTFTIASGGFYYTPGWTMNGNSWDFTLGGPLYGSATYDPASLADGAGVTTTVTVTGAALGDYCRASFGSDLQGVMMTAWVSSANTVSVRFQNETGAPVDLASSVIKATVQKL